MIKAIKNKVIIDPIESPTETESGLYIGEAKESNSSLIKATVVSVGEEVRDVKVGQIVVLPVFSGQPLNYKQYNYRVVFEAEIAGIVENV